MNDPKRTSSYGFTCIKNACEINKFWALSLQPAELSYYLPVYLCWMENSCLRSWYVKKMASIKVASLNKTDVQNFPPKYLFTLRTIWVFINVCLNLVVLFPNFLWSRWKGQLEWNNSHYLQNTSYWIHRVASTTRLLTDGNMKLGSGNMVS